VDLSACERILVVKPSSLGDVVHALPAARALHRAAPGAKIDWLVNTEWAPLLEGAPFLERIVRFPRREFAGPQGWLAARAWADRELRTHSYDLAVDFQGLLRSAALARRSGAAEVVGFRRAREGAKWFYHRRVDVADWDRRHAVDRNLALAAAHGADTADVDFDLPAGDPVPLVSAGPGEERGAILLHPFSRGEGKSLAPAEVRELCRRLAPRPVWLVGRPAPPATEPWPDNVVDLLERTTLPQLIFLARRAAWTVSVDSGPMHLAAGITDRILSLHTWSNPAMVGPWRPGAWIWRESELHRVRDLDPDRFPERRDRKREFARRERLLAPADIEAIADFLEQRLAS